MSLKPLSIDLGRLESNKEKEDLEHKKTGMSGIQSWL